MMNKDMRRTLGTLGAFLLLASQASAATLIIDSFNDSSFSSGLYPPMVDTGFKLQGALIKPTVTPGFPLQHVQDSNNGGVLAGVSRAGRLTLNPGGADSISAEIVPGTGTLNVLSGANTGFVELDYSANPAFHAPNGEGIGVPSVITSLSGYSQIEMQLTFFNEGNGNSEDVFLTLEDASGASSSLGASMSSLGMGGGTLTWDLSNAAFASIDMTDIRRIFFQFELLNGTDFHVDIIQATNVPEPTTWVLWSVMGLGLVGAIVGIRRRK